MSTWGLKQFIEFGVCLIVSQSVFELGKAVLVRIWTRAGRNWRCLVKGHSKYYREYPFRRMVEEARQRGEKVIDVPNQTPGRYECARCGIAL